VFVSRDAMTPALTGVSSDDQTSGAPRRPDLPALTGLRFLAAAAVVLFHYRSQISELLPPFGALEPITAAGYLGVDLFFVLSGFILTYNYLDWFRRLEPRAYLRFLGFRFARIYPIHLFTIGFLALPVFVAIALGEPLSHPESFSVEELLRNLLLIQGWTRPTQLSWNYPSWSISAEWFAYLLFPLVAFCIARLRSPALLVVSAFAAIALQRWISAAFGLGDSALVRISGEFLMGCLIGQLVLIGWRPRWRWQSLSFLCAILIVAGVVFLPAVGLDRNWVILLFGPCLLALALGAGHGDSWLGNRPMVFLGDASYALYMIHALVGDTAFGLAPASSLATAPLVLRAGVVSVVLLAMLGTAAFTFLVLERPSRRYLRLWVQRRLRHSATAFRGVYSRDKIAIRNVAPQR
jgi:peptidoglycan/LPS O-acetylase OafA/YrhL